MRKTKILIVLPTLLLLAQSCSLNPLGGGQSFSGGVLKSVDSGENWELVNKVGEQGSLRPVSVARIRMDPAERETLYLASPNQGVYQSTNSGGDWKKTLTGVRVYDLQVNLKDGNEIFAGGSRSDKAKLFKSTDAAQTWIEVFTEARSNNFVSAVVYDRTSPKNVYIALSTGEIILSKDSGSTWDLLSKLEGRILKIAFAAGDSKKVYALSMEKGLYKSTDGGATWTIVGEKLGGAPYQDFLVLTNPGVIYLASASGLHRSVDDGATWERVELPTNELSKVVSAVTVNPKDANQIFAVIAQTLYKSSDSGKTWQVKALPISASVRAMLIHPEETNIMYSALGQVLQ
ncbi:MAG: hypothetical protein HY397_00290 [Candidatus Doudnabacteria bacterium]|nr:hypothetical protein [Candidatus Doudnabacteria bacterium]